MKQLPARVGELLRLAARKKLMEHRIQPLRHRTDEADQGFGIHGVELVSTRGAPKGVVTPPLPELNPVGELGLETHLLAGPHHGLTAIEVQSFDGQQ